MASNIPSPADIARLSHKSIVFVKDTPKTQLTLSLSIGERIPEALLVALQK
jgi:hypothetical protein